MKWLQYKINTVPPAVEAISYQLHQLGVQGIEIEDTLPLSKEDKEKMYVDILDKTNQLECNTASIYFYISENEYNEHFTEKIKNLLIHVKNYVAIGEGSIQINKVNEEDWAENWKKYFKPFKVDENIIIKPTWESYTNIQAEDIIIEIDPGMAFGTGTHETTSLCISMLKKYLKSGYNVYDIGCGSGILGIVASKLGASDIICTDIDANAIKVANENITVNNVQDNVKVKQGNLAETLTEKVDIVVANILADVIITLTKEIKNYLKINSIFITSGIILERVEDVKRAIEKENMKILEIKTKGEWAVIVAQLLEA